MAKEFQFPTKAVRDWAVIGQSFRDLLRRENATEAMEADVMARMKEHWDRFSFAFPDIPTREVAIPFPAESTHEQQEAFKAAIQDAFVKPLAEATIVGNTLVGIGLARLLRLEIDLYRAEHPW